MKIGAHIGSEHPLAGAAARGADVVQIFLSNPQSYKAPLPRPDAEELRASAVDIYVHAPYIMNPANPESRIRIPSRKTIAETMTAAAAIGAKGVVVHGGHVGDDEDVAVGFERWRKVFAYQEEPWTVPLLIENTAGGGNAVVRELANYGPLWEQIGQFNVGVVLDTCHAWAAGADLASAVPLVRGLTGRIDLIHCNNSRDPKGSHRDRHANLTAGEIPGELLLAVVRAADAPVIVETPDDDGLGHIADIQWLREHV
ncbi:MAG: deoxyribonuclease IV [Actinobacteria bacterium]|nr:MAG: deoxyribonuclease IV [Actinomycetota bacterium]